MNSSWNKDEERFPQIRSKTEKSGDQEEETWVMKGRRGRSRRLGNSTLPNPGSGLECTNIKSASHNKVFRNWNSGALGDDTSTDHGLQKDRQRRHDPARKRGSTEHLAEQALTTTRFLGQTSTIDGIVEAWRDRRYGLVGSLEGLKTIRARGIGAEVRGTV